MEQPDGREKRQKSGRSVFPVLIVGGVAVLAMNFLNDSEGVASGFPYFAAVVLVIFVVYKYVKRHTHQSHAAFRDGLRDTDPAIREQTARQVLTYLKTNIDQFGDLTPFLLEAMNDPHPPARSAAVDIFAAYIDDIRFGKGGGYRVFPADLYPDIARALTDALEDAHPPVRRTAAIALEKLENIENGVLTRIGKRRSATSAHEKEKSNNC